MIVDAGPFIVDGNKVNSRLWALIKRATERGQDLHTTHPVLARVWRDPVRQANLARAVRYFEIHPLDESVTIGRRLAETATADVVDAHLVIVAESLGTFILTADPDDLGKLNARYEVY
jgi:predicted nucleic acid-binding protein